MVKILGLVKLILKAYHLKYLVKKKNSHHPQKNTPRGPRYRFPEVINSFSATVPRECVLKKHL